MSLNLHNRYISNGLVGFMVVFFLISSAFRLPVWAQGTTYKQLWTTELHYEKIIKEIESKNPSQLRAYVADSTKFLSSAMGDTSLVVDLGTMGHLDRISSMFDAGKGYFDQIAMGIGLLSKLMQATTGEEYHAAFNEFAQDYSMAALTNAVSNIVGSTAVLPAAVITWFLTKVDSIVVDTSEEQLWKRYQEIHESLLTPAMRSTVKAHLAAGTLGSHLDKVWEPDDLRVYYRGASLVSTWARADANIVKAGKLPEKFRNNFIIKHKEYFDGIAIELMQERAVAYHSKLVQELKGQLESIQAQLNRSLRFQFNLVDPRTGEAVSIGSHGIEVTLVGQRSPIYLSGTGPFNVTKIKAEDIWCEGGRDVLKLAITSKGGFRDQIVEFDVDWQEADSAESSRRGTSGQNLGDILLEPVASSTVVLDVTGDVRQNEQWRPVCYTDSLTRYVVAERPDYKRIVVHVKPGVHRLIISAPKHEARELEISTTAGQVINLDIQLERIYLEHAVPVPAKDDVSAMLPPISVVGAMNTVMNAYHDYHGGRETAIDASVAIWNAVMDIVRGVRENQALAWRSEDLAARDQEYQEWRKRFLEEREKLVEVLEAENKHSRDTREEFLQEWNDTLKDFRNAPAAFREWNLSPQILITDSDHYEQELVLVERSIELQLFEMLVDPKLLDIYRLDSILQSKLGKSQTNNPFDSEYQHWAELLVQAEGASAALVQVLPKLENSASHLEEMFQRGKGYLSGRISGYRHPPNEGEFGGSLQGVNTSGSSYDLLAMATAEIYSVRGHLAYFHELSEHLSLLITHLQKKVIYFQKAQQEYDSWLTLVAQELDRKRSEEAALEAEIARLIAERDSLKQSLESTRNVQLGGGMSIVHFPLSNDVLESAMKDGRTDDMQRYLKILNQVNEVVPTLDGSWDQLRERATRLEDTVYSLSQIAAVTGRDLVYTRPFEELSHSARRTAAYVERWVADARPYVEATEELQQEVEEKVQTANLATEQLASLVVALEELVATGRTLQGLEELGRSNPDERIVQPLQRLLADTELINSSQRAKDLAKRANSLLFSSLPDLKGSAPDGALDSFYEAFRRAWESKDLTALTSLLHPNFRAGGFDYDQTVAWLEKVFASFKKLEFRVYQMGSSTLRANRNKGELGQFVIGYSLSVNGEYASANSIYTQEDVEDVLVVSGGELKLLASSQPLWARFGDDGGPRFLQVAVNHQPLAVGMERLILSSEQLPNNKLTIRGWVRGERLPITAVQVSLDGGSNWSDASIELSDLMVSFTYVLDGLMDQSYQLAVRAQNALGLWTTFGDGSTYTVQVVSDSTRTLASEALASLAAAFTDGDTAEFLTRVSPAFYPSYGSLESAISQAIADSDERSVQFTVGTAEVASWGVFVETSWVSKEQNGTSLLLFTPGWQLREIRGDVPFALRTPQITQAASYSSVGPTKRGNRRLNFGEDKFAIVFATDLFVESSESQIYAYTEADGHFLHPTAMASFNYGILPVQTGALESLTTPPLGQFQAEMRDIDKGQVFVFGNSDRRWTVLHLLDTVMDWDSKDRYVEFEYIVHDTPCETGYQRP